MADPFVGEIRAFAFDYAPPGWLKCDGSAVPISEYQALYAVIGNTYGKGSSLQFYLPALNGVVPIAASIGTFGEQSGFGVLDDESDRQTSSFALGQASGAASVALDSLPVHGHELVTQTVRYPYTNMTNTPAANTWLARPVAPSGGNYYLARAFVKSAPAKPVALNPATIGSVGNAGPHENRQPYLALNFCICFDGTFPVPPS